MNIRIAVFLLLWVHAANGQNDSVKIHFNVLWSGKQVRLNNTFVSGEREVKPEVVRFYVSNLQLLQNGVLVDSALKKYSLVDMEVPESMDLLISRSNLQNWNTISFGIGVDSMTSVSGVFGGDLDPLNGMYWTWQSGYINVKLEGTSVSCPSADHRFEFHLGGYQYPVNTYSVIHLAADNKKDVRINLNLDQLFSRIDLAKEYQIMSPNEKAVHFSKLIASSFSIEK